MFEKDPVSHMYLGFGRDLGGCCHHCDHAKEYYDHFTCFVARQKPQCCCVLRRLAFILKGLGRSLEGM